VSNLLKISNELKNEILKVVKSKVYDRDIRSKVPGFDDAKLT
jgi:hypothetical protein